MKRGSSSSLLFVWRRCGDDCVSSRNLNGRFNGSMIHHPRSTFNEVSSCKAVEIQVLKGRSRVRCDQHRTWRQMPSFRVFAQDRC
ncbi:hypothetical protein F2Q70_00005120 [Brassica cretica]|uniref:Uncharacterized protein n=1 Tax=Brassica cretica TaxID=69181 RepID=A0A8S9J5Y9_BRACR|nr:hypothetical protein F2Q70_00005120 [Brassica cretica]